MHSKNCGQKLKLFYYKEIIIIITHNFVFKVIFLRLLSIFTISANIKMHSTVDFLADKIFQLRTPRKNSTSFLESAIAMMHFALEKFLSNPDDNQLFNIFDVSDWHR